MTWSRTSSKAASPTLTAIRCIASWLYFWLLLGNALANDVVLLPPETGQHPLGKHVSYLEDATRKVTVAEILSGKFDSDFVRNTSPSPNLGFTSSTYWFRTTLRSEDPGISEWLLEVQYPLLDYIDLHLVYAGPNARVISYRGGDRVPFSERQVKHRNMLFKVPLEAGETVTMLMRVRTDSSMQVPLMLWNPEALLERDQDEYLVLGAFYGILMAMLLFNLMIYLANRDINYLYYVIYLVSVQLFQGSLNGLAFEYLWPEHPWWANVATPFSIGLVYTSIILFTREFLNLRRHLPRIDKVFKVFSVLFVMVMVASVLLSYTITIKVGTFLTMMATFLVFTAGALCLKKGVLHAKYFMLAWTVLLFFIIVYALKTVGVLPHVFVTEYGLQIGAALETILLSYALAHRLRLLRMENEAIQRGITETLERRVRERTAELDVALKGLSDANQKLTALSQTDGLTGLHNRTHFNQVFGKEWRRCQRAGEPISLLLLDVDHFKKVNDTYGHLGGDTCLKQVASTFLSVLQRPADAVFRMGGEEFVVLLPATDGKGAFHVAERIRKAIESLDIQFEARRIPVTLSIGACTVRPDKTADEESLMRNADHALYEAKNGGRNRTCIFEMEQGEAVAEGRPA